MAVASQPVGAYAANSTWTVASSTSATTTAASGLTTTVTTTGGVAVTGHDPLSQTNSPTSSEFTPQLPLSVDALRWSVTNDGTVTIRFSRPVRNPSVHLEGIGAFAGSGTDFSAYQSAYTLESDASDGAALGAVSAGATNLRITGGDTITTNGNFPDTQCNSSSSSGQTEDGTAGCGSVAINGTVSQLTFAVDYRSTIIAGFGAPGASGDAVGFAVTVDQDYSDAPASYNAGDAPRHVIGDLALGRTVDADNRTELDSTTSPFAAIGTAVNTGGDNASGADEDALTAWPALTTAMIGSKYSVTVPISGASAAGEVCGYLDFAHTGSFSTDPQEQACAPFAAGAHSVELTWTVPSTMTAGLTYARLRAAYDPDQAERPTGPAASGEVEDYAVSILATVTIRNSMPAHTGGHFDLSVNNTVHAHNTGDGGSTGGLTVGPAAGSLARPDIAISGDLASSATQLTVSESPAGASGFGYDSAVTCADAAGTVIASATTTFVGVAIPASGAGNGGAQNITCTFTNTGIATLAVTASAAPATVAAIGRTVNFAFTVTNTGPVPVTSIGLVTRLAAPAGPTPKLTCPASALDPQQTMTCTAAYPVTAADFNAGAVRVTATASAQDPNGAPVTAPPAGVAVATTQRAGLTLTSGAPPATVTAAGQQVSHPLIVTNTGTVTVRGLVVANQAIAPTTRAPVINCPSNTLAAGATLTCTAAYTATAADLDAGQIKAATTATAVDVNSAAVTAAPLMVSIPVTQSPQLTLTQIATPVTAAAAGQHLTFSFTVTNSGNVTVQGLTVNDSISAPAGPSPSVSCPQTTINPGAQVTCTATYEVTAADMLNRLVENRATATATGAGGAKVSAGPSTVDVPAADGPALTLFTSAAPAAVVVAGQVVNVNLQLANSGNVAINGLTVAADPISATAAPLHIACPVSVLAPGALTNCTASYQVAPSDIGAGSAIMLRASATGTDANAVTTSSNRSTAIVSTSPEAAVALTAVTPSVPLTAAGQPVAYSFTVTNTGNLNLTAIAVKQTVGGGPADVSCPVTALDPAMSTTCTATYRSTAADISAGTIATAATAAATGPSGDPVSSAAAPATVTVVPGPALEVTTVGTPTALSAAGDTVSYAYLVTNTGNAALSAVHITSSLAGASGRLAATCAAAVLAPNASTTCAAPAYTAPQADVDQGRVKNTATAAATTASSTDVASAASTVETVIDAPSALAVTLTGNVNGAATVGDVATVTAKVTNTGLTTIKDLTLTTPTGPIRCGQAPLAPAASITCALPAHTVTEVDTNTGQVATIVVASGRAVGGPVHSEQAVFASAVAAPIPLTGVFDLGPTLGAGGGAVLAGIGLLLLASTTGTRRRGRAT